MSDNGNSKINRSVSIRLDEVEGRIEKLLPVGGAPEKVRICCWKQEKILSMPLDLTEDELVDLLQRAIRANILSENFLKNLHSEFEI